MPEFRETISLAATGTVAVGTPDRWESGYNGEITGLDATLGTASSSGAVTFDLRKNGTSLFTGVALANISTNVTAQSTSGGINNSVTTFDVQPVGNRVVGVGSVILVDTEQMVVTSTAGSPVGGPSGFGNAYRLTVTRGANGTTAAAHAANAPVTYALPTIPATQTQLNASYDNINLGNFAADDVLDINVTSAGTGAAQLRVNLEFVAE